MITTLLYRSPRLFALAVAMVLVLGLSSLLTIGRQEDPTITNLFATIVTPYPGADPGRVEALVTKKIEDELTEIAEIDEITSTSRTGISVITVRLSDFLPNSALEQTWSEIRDALSDAAVELPPGVPEPTFDNDRIGAYTAISAITAAPGRSVPPGILDRYAQLLQDRLRQVPLTKFVHRFGEPDERVLVTTDVEILAGAGLAVGDLVAAIRGADSKVRAGQVSSDEERTVIEVAGEIDGLDRIARVPVADDRSGGVLRVGDVADIALASADPPATIALSNGRRAVLVAARMEDDKQVDAWMARVRAVLDDFEAELPAGLTHELVFDQSVYTADRLRGVGINLAVGVGLVIAILFLTLGWRPAVVVATILPLSALGSVAMLQWLGVPIHQMSVTGLIVALGLLVDGAIVMADRVQRGLDAGEPRGQVVDGAVRLLAVPLLASTITTALAFTPMATLPGPAGDFVGSIAIAVIVMLSVSFLLALTITPAIAGWLLRSRDGEAAGRPSLAARLFAATVRASTGHPRLSILSALVVPVIGFGAFPTLTAQFFPGVDRDQFHIQVFLPQNTSTEGTRAVVEEMQRRISASDGIESLQWTIGESAPAFYYNMRMYQDGASRFAEALVTTTDPATTERLIPLLQRRLDAEFPQAQVLARGLVQGPPVDAPLEIRVIGPEIATLRRVGEAIRQRMTATPGITHTTETMPGGAPKLVVDLDEDKVRRAGLDLRGIAAQLDAQFDGLAGGSLLQGTEELPVVVRLPDAGRGAPADLRDVTLLAPGADPGVDGAYRGVPLTALGSVRLEPAETPITRRDGERVNTIQGYIAHGLLPQEVLETLQADLAADPVAMPPGYRLEVGGDADARGETVNNLISTLGVVLVLSLATIVLTFRSYRLSMVAIVVCGLSMGSSLFALAVFDYPFGIQALIGVIGSIGVSINAAIIVLSALRDDARAAAGDRERIAEIVVESGRHIVSTTVTTFAGFLPLIIEGGGFWPPFAMAIAGGVLLSCLISFYFTPPVFQLLYAGRPSGEVRPRLSRDEPPPALPAASVARAAE